MSTARDEADAGPESSADEAGSVSESKKGGEEQSDHEGDLRRGTKTALHGHDETASSAGEDVEFDDYVQPDQTTDLASKDAPTIMERPSSADGSLSIPDDTPSLQVASHPTATSIAMLKSAGFCSFLYKQASTTVCVRSKSNPFATSVRPTIPSSRFSIAAKFSSRRFTGFPASALSYNICQ